MRPAVLRRASAVLAVAVVAAGLQAAVAHAQPAHETRALPAAQRQPVNPAPDFFFGRPHGSISVRGGWVFARAGSDIFDFLTERLTLDAADFNAPALSADVALALTPRLDAVFGFEFARAKQRSEYRDFVDDDFLPIEQDTSLKTVHLSGAIRYALVPRGRSVSRLAWVPRHVVPYVGAGGGASWYELRQSGDFVDFADLSVFDDVFTSGGWGPAAHVFGGVDVQVYRRLFATAEARYVWASATLGSDFLDFEPIDLAGFRATAGISVIF